MNVVAAVSPVLQRHRSLRWLVPAGVLTVAGLAATGMFSASARSSTELPPTTPVALLAAVRAAPVTGFTGTVVSRVSLGLPELPAFGASAGTDLSSLLSGSHTLQVWYGGRTEQRIALLGASDETDVFRAGRELWVWSSADRIARHAVLPAAMSGAKGSGTKASGTKGSGSARASTSGSPDLPSSTVLPSLTPSGLASAALAALTPTTIVQAQSGDEVADRSTYRITLTPRTTATRLGSIRISVDGRTKLPLAVQIYARGASSPSIDVSYTSVHFGMPAQTYFHFSPPSGAKVRSLALDPAATLMSRGGAVTATGSGWTRVVAMNTGHPLRTGAGELGRALTPVSGRWGKGGLLQTDLLSVLVTDDGRVYSGAVDPSALYAAAGSR